MHVSFFVFLYASFKKDIALYSKRSWIYMCNWSDEENQMYLKDLCMFMTPGWSSYGRMALVGGSTTNAWVVKMDLRKLERETLWLWVLYQQ